MMNSSGSRVAAISNPSAMPGEHGINLMLTFQVIHRPNASKRHGPFLNFFLKFAVTTSLLTRTCIRKMQLWTLTEVRGAHLCRSMLETVSSKIPCWTLAPGELQSPSASIMNLYAESNTLFTSTMCSTFLQFQLGEQVLIFNAYFVLSLLSSD